MLPAYWREFETAEGLAASIEHSLNHQAEHYAACWRDTSAAAKPPAPEAESTIIRRQAFRKATRSLWVALGHCSPARRTDDMDERIQLYVRLRRLYEEFSELPYSRGYDEKKKAWERLSAAVADVKDHIEDTEEPKPDEEAPEP
jgi:hypothetical protein